MGKQLHSTDRLQSKILLYRENNPDKVVVEVVFKHDLQKGPDAIIIIETYLKVLEVRILVKEFCLTAKARRKLGITL